MTTRTFEKINDIFNCKLHLEDGTEFTIPLREDGYIYATGLCKVGGKKMYNWLRLKETKKLQKEVEKKLVAHIGATTSKVAIEKYQSGNAYSQGTWIHPDLGLNLAQWCSTNFAAQVSKWLKELIFTGSVELEKEKSNEEITNGFQKLLKETVEAYEKKLEESHKKVEAAENLAKAYDANHKHMEKKYREIHLNHQAYLRRKELYKLKTGSCVYIIDMKQNYGDEEECRYKIGQTSDLTNRVSGFRTSNPFCKVIMVLYTEKNIDLEKNMKIKYEKQLLPNNSEFVTGVSKETLIENLLKIADILSLEYTVESEEELHKFNRHIIHEKDVVEIHEEKITDGMKRCGGFRHKTEEERLQPLTNFFKHGSHHDGRARLCKECYLVGVYGDKRKKKKVVTIPEFDTTTHKWCNRCESVKEYKNFQHDKSCKDGYNSNCRACKAEQRRIYLEKKKKEKKEKEKEEEETIPIEVLKEDKERLEEVQSKNPLERYKKTELMQLMKGKGIKVTFKMTKNAMIEKLSS